MAEAIRTAVNDEGVRQHAAALGQRIRAEDGAQNAAKLIRRYLDD